MCQRNCILELHSCASRWKRTSACGSIVLTTQAIAHNSRWHTYLSTPTFTNTTYNIWCLYCATFSTPHASASQCKKRAVAYHSSSACRWTKNKLLHLSSCTLDTVFMDISLKDNKLLHLIRADTRTQHTTDDTCTKLHSMPTRQTHPKCHHVEVDK